YGSSSHLLLLKYLKENNLRGKVNIEFKDLAVGVEELKKDQIAAISVWEPFKTISLENNNKVLYDGKNTKEDYLSGIVINTATINKKEVKAMNKAIIKSHKFIKSHPKRTVKIISEETGYSKSTVKKAIKNIEFNQKISSKDIKTFQNNQKTLIEMKEMNKYDFEDYLYYQQN
ncbi:ABC transporter substrate-binding protein, partial [Staphylococcus saprophyticus]|uniref:ABC transporter substrate-binding protein n=1 Tax=Staphylococcus saprophyticus TaxID=29385 RepID=UPI000FF3163F